MKKFITLAVGLAVIVGVFSLNWLRRDDNQLPLFHVAPPESLDVDVVTPRRQTIVQTVHAPGDIEAVLDVEIRSEIAAKIEAMPVEEGDRVEAGELLCRLNDDEFRAMVESGEASVGRLKAVIRQAEADLFKSERDYARQERLAAAHATSAIEISDYRTRLVKAQAAVEIGKQQLAEADAMLRRAREDLNKTVITSPINGVVSTLHAEAGEVVVTGTMNNPGTVIMVITDMSRMQVRARVDESDIHLVRPDQPVEIYLPNDPHRALPGRVLRVATSGSRPAGRDVVTFETLILVETDDPSVRPGMTANVEVQVARKSDALTVPLQAVVHRKRKDLPEDLVREFDRSQESLGHVGRQGKAQHIKVVFCVDGDEAHPRLVTTGIADLTRVELLAGIETDAEVIVGPYRSLDKLKDGSPIRRQADHEASPASPAPTRLAEEDEAGEPTADSQVNETASVR